MPFSIECEPCRVKVGSGRSDGGEVEWNIIEVDLTDKLDTCCAHITNSIPDISSRSLFAVLHVSSEFPFSPSSPLDVSFPLPQHVELKPIAHVRDLCRREKNYFD